MQRDKPLSETDLSTRAKTGLSHYHQIETIGDLLSFFTTDPNPRRTLARVPNFGGHTVHEISALVESIKPVATYSAKGNRDAIALHVLPCIVSDMLDEGLFPTEDDNADRAVCQAYALADAMIRAGYNP